MIQRQLVSLLLPLPLLLFFAACTTTSPTTSGPNRSATVDNYRLPAAAKLSLAEIDALRQQPDQGTETLRRDLLTGSTPARIRAAHAIEKLGGVSALEKDLITALQQDDDPLSRIFICRALAAAKVDSPEALAAAQEIYRHTQNPVVETYAAGTILCITRGKAQNELQHLLDQLDPRRLPPGDATAAQTFWECRWAAAYMIARLGSDGTHLIPNVERSTEALLMPVWVERQLFLTLRELSR